MLATLLLAGLVNMIAGALFVLVGIRFVPRRTSRENELANQAFAVYWSATGRYAMLAGALEALAAFGHTPFGLFLFARYASLPILTLAVGSVTFYFVYLFTGRQTWVWPIAAVYSSVLMAMTFYVGDREPIGVLVSAWNTDLLYAQPYESTTFRLILLLLALPPIVGAAFYITLRRNLAEAHDRRRVLLVGTSILAWSLAASLTRIADGDDLLEFLSRPVLGLLVATTVLAAYRPSEAAPAYRTRAALAEARRRALDERLGQLI